MSKNKKNKASNSAATSTPAPYQNEKAKWFGRKLKLLMEMLEFTTPHGDEKEMHKFLPKGGNFDKLGNYILTIPAKEGSSKTLFCCHIDTVGHSKKKVEPIYENGWIRVGNKDAACLGGDDRCGILCLLHLIEHKIPGTYIFHIGEERGLIGARHIEKTFELSVFDRGIEFDRRGEASVITEMGVVRTCSDDFAEDLCKQLGLNFKPDNTGVSTDVKAYEDQIAECTNISVGYRSEHSNRETINADFLINDLLAAIIKVDWDKLPVKRDPKGNNKTYSTTYSAGNFGNYAGGSHNHWGRNNDPDWEEYTGYASRSADERYRRHTVATFTNHAKVLRENGVIETNGDLISDADYIECELCANCEGPFTELNIIGTDFLLCEDCASYLKEGWDPEEFNVEQELAEELEYLVDSDSDTENDNNTTEEGDKNG